MSGGEMRVAVSGAAGRMGRAVIAACRRAPGTRVVAATERPGSPHLGKDAGEWSGGDTLGLRIAGSLHFPESRPDVLIDFSQPEGTGAVADRCREAGVRMVIGTTGLEERQRAAVAAAAERVAVVFAPNMSVGVNLCFGLLETAARVLGDRAEIEIVETHHSGKRDAPSGTALQMGRIVCEALGRRHESCAVYGRSGPGGRDPGSIGYASLRIGSAVGEHTVLFGLPGERVEIGHRAESREIFADGAVRAARWVVARPPGLYDMRDVLGLPRHLAAAGQS